MQDKTLTFIGFNAVVADGAVLTHFSTGRIIAKLAEEYKHIYWCAPVNSSEKTERHSFAVPKNVTLIPLPKYTSTLNAMSKLKGITSGYENGIKLGDHVFIRGLLPGTKAIYRYCKKYHKAPVHWIVGNSYQLMREGHRDNWYKDLAALLYAYNWFRTVKRGLKATKGIALCNGCELFDLMGGVNRYEVVSSTVTENETYCREDTCQNDTVRIVSTCFIRPEKGIEYLIDAIPLIETSKKIELICIGSFEKGCGYKALLDRKIESNNLSEQVKFMGYCDPSEFVEMYKTCDIFVLPSLSEGTPRCIIESRAAGLPTISTRVGGIPSSITDGVDGLLVPSKSPLAIARAIKEIIENQTLRKQMIENGYQTVKRLSLNNFVKKVISTLKESNGMT